MILQDFFNGTDALQLEKVTELASPSTDAEWRLSASVFAADLVLTSDGTTKPYTTGNFWTKINEKMVQLGQVPGTDSDQTAIADLMADLSIPAAYTTQAAYVAFVFGKVSAFIAEQAITDTTVTSAVKQLINNPKYLILSVKTSGWVSGESVAIKLLTSADGVNFVTKSVGTILAIADTEFVIDTLVIPKFYKVSAVVVGTVTVSVISTLKY